MQNITFSPPDITEEEIAEVAEALRSGWITTGPRTKHLEKELAEYCKTEEAVCLNSATAALELTLHAMGIGPGDEVITSAYTYTASASPIEHVGAKIVLVDTAPNSYEMDYAKVTNAITNKTKAIIPVDIAGIACDYDRLFGAAEEHRGIFQPRNKMQEAIGRVAIVADAAHALGSQWHGKIVGEIADFTTFSFHAVKNFTTGEGGAVTWRTSNGIENKELYNYYQLLSLHGQSKDALAKTKLGAWEYDIKMLAYKCNLTDIVAALGLVQLKRYPKLLARRREIIEQYDLAFKNCDIQVLNHFGKDHTSCGHLYLVRLLGKDLEYRNEFILKMAERGIGTNVHYKPLPMHTAYMDLGFNIKDYPNAYDMYKNEISLPLHTKLKDEDVAYIVENFKEILKGM
ncbi:MAG: DegT/DnrJ/EryC1/StrS family aminotransferase [Acidaminococcaceae bacterium]